jgi:UDP-N-acetylmuramate-alanine ligase
MSYYLAEDKKEEFHQLFDFIFTGKKLPYELIKKYYFILEACEYKRHFLHLDLEYLLITNLELDHTDYYKDFEDYKSAFIQMNQNTKRETLVLENNDKNTVKSDFS